MAQLIEEMLLSHEEQYTDRVLRAFIGYRLKRGFGLMLPGLHDLFSQYDLRLTSSSALIIIVDNPGLTQSKLSNVLGLKRSNMVRIIDDLEKRKLVKRDKVPGDGRAYALTPTKEGKALAYKVTGEITELENRIYSVLTKEQREQLFELLDVIEQGNK